MIESINLKNYKAFDDVTIPIKPLTLLLGANSVGKSSIIQMLMLLHQTAEERQGMYSSALKIYGNYVNIGDYKNIFKDGKIENQLVLKIKLSNEKICKYLREFKNDFVSSFVDLTNLISPKELWNEKSNGKPNRIEFEKIITRFQGQIEEFSKKDENFFTFIKNRLDLPFDNKNNMNINDLLRCYDFRQRISDIENYSVCVSYTFTIDNSKLKIVNYVIEIADNCKLLEIENKTDSNIKISSFYNLNNFERDIILENINLKNTIFNVISGNNNRQLSMVSSSLIMLAYNIMNVFQNEFYESKINYVSPLRAHPKRYYMLDKAKMTISLDTLDGDAIAEVLKENSSVKKKVNGWFEKFDFKIDVKQFREVIHNVSVTQNGLALDITDVGFGISQVLPIIIQGFLSERNSLTIIEQPEIHLHPKMQADLGDLLIDIVNSDHKSLIIETHSEYILRRVRRRISEGKIKKDDVSICLFHPRTKDHAAWVEQLEIEEKGAFKWPEEYYDGELTLDVTEFLKNQY